MKKNNKKGIITICDNCPCNCINDYGPWCGLGYDNYEGPFKKLGGKRNKRANNIGGFYYNYWHTWSNECHLTEINYLENGKPIRFEPERRYIK